MSPATAGLDLSQDQKDFYAQAVQRCADEVNQMNAEMRREWENLLQENARVNALIEELENRKLSVGQMHASACSILGIPDDLDLSPAIQQEG